MKKPTSAKGCKGYLSGASANHPTAALSELLELQPKRDRL